MENICIFLIKLLTAALLVAATPLTAGATPETINYQGRLLDNSGTPISGTVSMTFRIYVPGDIFVKWRSTRDVLVENGIYQILLGEIEALDSVDFSQSLELGVTVESDGEMTPRLPLSSVAHAQKAFDSDHATVASNADTLDSLDSSDFIQKSDAGTISTKMIIDGTITAADLGANSVGSEQITSGAIVGGIGGDILDGSITYHDLGSGSVGAIALSTDSVRSDELVEDVVFGRTGDAGSISVRNIDDTEVISIDGSNGQIVASTMF